MLLSPLVGDWPVVSPFGARRDPITGQEAGHHGVDYGCPVGTMIQAVADGQAYRLDIADDGAFDGNGNAIWLDLGGGVTCAYLHLSEISPDVMRAPVRGEAGVRVQVHAGQILGLTGDTGRTTGPHLHFGVWIYGEAVDPVKLITGSTPWSGHRILHRGLTGSDVRQVQQALNMGGWSSRLLAMDGVYGPATEAAVIAFQRGNGLAADGWVGPVTWRKLVG